MNAFKRFFALILSLCMVLSFVPVSAFAAGTGTAATAPAGISGATEPFPLSLMTQQGNSGGHFRIPAMVTLDNGTLVAAADVRWQTWDTTDDNGNIDTVVSYSKNNGDTWEVTFGNYFTCSTPFAENWGSPTIIDPGLITDGEKVYMIADLFPGQSNGAGNCTVNSQYAVGYDSQGRMLLRANAGTNDTGYYLEGGKIYATDGAEQTGYTVDAWFNLSQNGTYVRNLFEYSTTSFMPVMTPHLYMTEGTFDANGVLSWSEPTMLNPILRSASEKYYLVSPGRGIKTKDDVLVIGGYGNASGGEKASIIFFDGTSWHRSSSEASSVSSESEIVELSDGTLRMFVRHSGNGNYVQYIDWTPVYTAGKITDYTPSAAVNTTAVANNNVNIGAIAYSKTSGGKQIILVSCSGNTSGRYNGKIFTFTVDPQTKAMTLANTVEVDGVSDAYSYSCMTELADGTVGLLYEKGDSGNITYAEYDPEELTGLEFDEAYDIFAFGSDNTQGEVKVKQTAGVTHIHTQPNTGVTGVGGDYVAYDVVLCTGAKEGCSGTDSTRTYTGEATVTIPVSGELASKELKGFVVNSNGSLEYITDVTVRDVNGVKMASFKVPHFSTVGVTAKTAEDQDAEHIETVRIEVGDTAVFEDASGLYLDADTTGLSAAVATVSLKGTIDTTQGIQTTPGEALSPGRYVLKNTKSGKFASNLYHSFMLKQVTGTTVDVASTVWTINPSDSGYTIQDQNNMYLKIKTDSSLLTSSAVVLNLSAYNNTWEIADSDQYLNDFNGQGNYLKGYGTEHDPGSLWQIINVTNVTGTTTVTFTGVAPGNTSVKIGSTTYNIEVVWKEVDVELLPGESKPFQITGEAYTDADITGNTSGVATVTVGQRLENPAVAEAVNANSFVSGAQYLLINCKGNWMVSDQPGENDRLAKSNPPGVAASDSEQYFWTITRHEGDVYTIQNSEGKYLDFSQGKSMTVADRVDLNISVSPYIGCWIIKKVTNGSTVYLNNFSGAPAGWQTTNKDGDVGNQWQFDLIEYTEETDVTITGVAPGDTSVIVGNTKYNIHVAYDSVDVLVSVGGTVTKTIEGYVYTSGTVADETKVSMTVGTIGGEKSIEDSVTAIESGKTYVLYNTHCEKLLNNTWADASVGGGGSDGLGLGSAKDNFQDADCWTITETEGGYYVRDAAGKYLTIGAGKAGLSDNPVVINLDHHSSYWTIGENGQYLNNYGGQGTAAAGYSNINDSASRWLIYEVEESEATGTKVTFEGLAVGTTTATVGHVTYNITVAQEVVNVDLMVGETQVFDPDVNFDDANLTVKDSSIADVTIKEVPRNSYTAGSQVTTTDGLTVGNKYVIMNRNATMALTNVSTVVDSNHKLTLGGTTADVNRTMVWTLAAYDSDSGVAKLQDVNGKCLTIAAAIAYVGEDNEVIIHNEGSHWTIRENMGGNIYLNQAGGSGTIVDGWSGGSPSSAQSGWYIYDVTAAELEPGTEVSITGKYPGNTTATVGGVLYNINVHAFEKNFSMEVGEDVSFTPAVEISDAEIDAFNATYGSVVTVEMENGKVVFHGEGEGKVERYQLGATIYTINVTPDLADEDDSNYVGGEENTQGHNNVITGLIISNNTSYDLNVDTTVVTGTVTWGSSDDTLFTVDANGNITAGDHAGEGYVTVYEDGVPYQTIPVKVLETNKSATEGGNRTIDVYNTTVKNCTSYYTYNNVELKEFPVGYQLYVVHDYTETDLVTFYATPDEGYALTLVTGKNGEYFHSVTEDGGNTFAQMYDSCASDGSLGMVTGGYAALHDQLMAYVVNNTGSRAATAEQVHEMLENAVLLEVDGAFFFSKGDGTNNTYNRESIISTVVFIADKLPTIDKEVQGIQDATLIKEGGWREYVEGDYAKVGEYIFYKITVTQYAPEIFQTNDATAQLIYNEAILTDMLNGAYFYTKDLDMEDGKWDAHVPNPTNVQNIKNALNADWTEEQKANGRVHEFYVAYRITESDVNKDIVNTVQLSTKYQSVYSKDDSASKGNAHATMKVLGESLGDILLDFGLPVTMTLSREHLADTFDEDNTNAASDGCKYGSVKIEQIAGADTDALDDDRWNVTYIPDKMFSGYDVVYLMDSNNELKNYFRVYPASTVYYEESFAKFGTANGTDGPEEGWSGKDGAITGEAEYLYVGCGDPAHNHTNFGYSEKYAVENGMSNGTQAISKHSGDTATFQFTGTGFDVYGNVDPNTSVMAVMVYRVQNATDGSHTEKLVKFYQVITASKAGETNATDGQAVAANSIPLVSVNGMEHGTYKVIVRHTKKMDDKTAEIRLDGFRVYNTLKDADRYYPAEEQFAYFTELRDEALTALTGVSKDTTIDQIYSGTQTIGNPTVLYLTSENGTDLLNNGPKNEIWLSAGTNLAFMLSDSVAAAQIGLKAPTGKAVVTITTTVNGTSSSKNITITTATDMFYRLPGTAAGAAVTIEVTEGLLSVTKLKSAGYAVSPIDVEPLMAMNESHVSGVLDVIYDRKPAPITSNVTRIYGDNRFETAFKVADELKTVLGVEKFDSIIVASGTNFADALSGSYLATVKNAPILLSYDATYDQMVRDYIAENLAENGTVYILGGEAAVASSMDDALAASGVTVKRLAGANRFETNLAILSEAGVKNEEILVCTGTNFADSLSASAAGLPILLVHNESGKLTDAQTKYLAQLNGCTFTVIGGEKAVCDALMSAVGAYGNVQRLAGANRFETSVAIAERYFSAPESVVLASAGNYPDGLCGGVLAHAMQAPLVLTMTGYEAEAQAYVAAAKSKVGVILGGAGLISDNSIVNIFNLTDALEIIVK